LRSRICSANLILAMPLSRPTRRSLALILVGGAAIGTFAYYKFRPHDVLALFDSKPTATLPYRPPLVGTTPPTRFAIPTSYGARLKQVVDGNTLVVIGNNDREYIVRLADTDAPALDQPYGAQARDELRRLASNTELQIVSAGVTTSGMDFAHVAANGVDLGGALLRVGAARVATSSSPPPDLMVFEQEAHDAQRGLWALPVRDRMRPCWSRGDC
jgi:endonuclease YncB( thermonuclease family)